MHDRPIIALDFPTQKEVAVFLEKFPKEEALFVKVGMELFTQKDQRLFAGLKNKDTMFSWI